MSEKAEEVKQKLQKLRQLVAVARQNATKGIAEHQALINQIKGYKLQSRPIKSLGWSKDVAKLGAAAPEIKAVQDAEQKGTRAGVEAAIKVTEKNKKLDPLTKKMAEVLKQDTESANKLKALVSEANALEAVTKQIEAKVASVKIPKL
jgi:hypothetical protein